MARNLTDCKDAATDANRVHGLFSHGTQTAKGSGNKLIEPEPSVGTHEGEIVCRERLVLGGLLKYYHRVSAAKAT